MYVWEKEQLAVKLPDDFSVEIIVPRDTADSFDAAVKSLRLVCRGNLLYSNETHGHRPRGTFAALSEKE